MICFRTLLEANNQAHRVQILINRLRARALYAEPDADDVQALAVRCREEFEHLNQLLAEVTEPKEESP